MNADAAPMKKLIVIGGATATGKTQLAIQLAQHFRTEIISADSRQFYREMNIGTAKPTAEELAAAPHHFVGFLSVSEDYSVGDFERDALAKLQEVFQKRDVAILVGGSGLYLKAVYEGLDKFPEISAETRTAIAEAEKSGGLAWLQAELQKRDPVHFDKVDQQNPARLRRALEVCWETGQPYSAFLKNGKKQARFFQPIYILLEISRPELYARIEKRVDAMLAAGLEAEAKSLLPFRQRSALKTVGYEEFFDFFEGKISRGTAIEKIKQHSRNYAKRQVTWFSKYGNWTAFRPDNFDGILAFIKLSTLKK